LDLTDKGAAASATFDHESIAPGIGCLPSPIPHLMVLPDFKSIEISEQSVVIRGESEAMVRTIWMDGNRPERSTSRLLYGHSEGRWDDGVLVVATTHFADHPIGSTYRIPSGREKRLMERFEIGADGNELTYTFRLKDPEYLVNEVTASVQWRRRPNIALDPRECSIDNARRYLEP
jgi:hypothetical protein